MPDKESSLKTTGQVVPQANLLVVVSVCLVVGLALFDWMRRCLGTELIEGWTPMKDVTALCFILSVISLILINTSYKLLIYKIISLLSAFFVFTLSLFQCVLQFYVILYHHELLGTELQDLLPHFSPAERMAPFSALNFVLISIILFLLHSNRKQLAGVAHSLILPVIFISFSFFSGYILDVYTLRDLNLIPASLNSAIAFCFLSFLIVVKYPNTWLSFQFLSREIGSISARKMLLFLLFLPVLIGWLKIYGERKGFFTSAEGVVLLTVAYTFFLLMLVWFAAKSVNRLDLQRRISHEKSLQSNLRLTLLSEVANRLLMTNEPQKLVQELCTHIMKFLDCQVFFNYLVKDSGFNLQLNAWSGISEKAASEIKWLKKGVAVCGCVARDGKRIIVEYVQTTPDERTNLVRSYGVRAYACHPLMSHDKVIGTLSFGTTTRDTFTEEELEMMKIVADQVAIAMARINNEKALRESEDKFRTIAESLPVLISITRKEDSCLIFTNNAYEKTLGFSKEELIGKKARDLYFDPEERNGIMKSLQEKGYMENIETRVKKSDGSFFWVMASVRAITIDGEPAFLSSMIDITQRRREQQILVNYNRTLNALGKSSQAMMHFHNEVQFLNEVCKIIIEDCGHAMVWVGYAREDENKSVVPVAHYGFDKGYIDNMKISWGDNERGRGPTGTAIRTGKPTVCRDMKTDPAFGPWRADALERGYNSSVVLPMFLDGKTFGAISIYSEFPDAFSQEEIDLLNDLATDLSYGISNIRLAESENKNRKYLENLINYANAPIIVWNTKKEIQLFNHAFEHLTGYSAEEVHGKKLDFLFPADSLKETMEKIQKALIMNWETIEIPILTKDSKVRIVLWNSANIFDVDNKSVISTIAQGNDITERILAEEALRNSKEKLDLTLEHTNIGVWSWDLMTNDFNCDERTIRLMCKESGCRIITLDDFEKLIYEEDIPHFKKALLNAIRDDLVFNTIIRPLPENGEYNYLNLKARLEKSKTKPVKMTGVCIDITEMKKGTEKTLFTLTEDLLKSNKELEQFAYVASHDLQEPLRMVSSFTQLLAARYKDKLDKEAREFIDFAVDGAVRMQHLISDLLDYSRIKTQGKSLTLVDGASVVEQALRNLNLRIQETGAEIIYEEMPQINVDESQMVHLFQNLIDNSLKFCRGKPQVRISVKESNDFFTFMIADNGIGIEPQYFERIFQIFQRLHLREAYEGTGIGLAICKRIVERHGGKIWVESQPEKGTVFKFTINKNKN